MSDFSLYLHIPFCQHRCSYCDFNTYAGLETMIPDYVRALCREIELMRLSAGERLRVHTVFLGGGTPSLLPVKSLEQILQTLERNFSFTPDLEVTLEANPGTLSAGYLKDIHHFGINRLSLGMQSVNPAELSLLERQHDTSDVIQAVAWARKAGFANLNLDLIFGLPYQSLDSWQRTLAFTVGLEPEHISLYALTLEHGTPMQHWAARGLLSEPDPDLAAEMYEWASDCLEQSGYAQYEISNWAQQDADGKIFTCRHNLQYWRNQPYLGLGAGAHGYAGGFRTANVLAPGAYIKRCLSGEVQPFPRTAATVSANGIDVHTEMGETMMMGLRLVQEGVSARGFEARFSQKLTEEFGKQIERLTSLGLLEWGGEAGDCLRLTRKGRLLGNQVFMEFI